MPIITGQSWFVVFRIVANSCPRRSPVDTFLGRVKGLCRSGDSSLHLVINGSVSTCRRHCRLHITPSSTFDRSCPEMSPATYSLLSRPPATSTPMRLLSIIPHLSLYCRPLLIFTCSIVPTFHCVSRGVTSHMQHVPRKWQAAMLNSHSQPGSNYEY